MAQAAGMTIDHLESVTENSGYNDYTINAYDGLASAKAETSGTGIRPGSISVTANVTVVYEAQK